jgi:hypothetical protein
MIVADTTVWIDFFNNINTPWVAVFVYNWNLRQLAVTDVIIVVR